MSEMEKQILDFFDRCPTWQQIRSLSLMYAVPEAYVIGILERNNREVPEKKTRKAKGRPPKAENVKNEPSNSNEEVKSKINNSKISMPIPSCVAETIENRMHELERDIKDYTDFVHKLEAEYAAHANFLLQCPFEQRDLSQNAPENTELKSSANAG